MEVQMTGYATSSNEMDRTGTARGRSPTPRPRLDEVKQNGIFHVAGGDTNTEEKHVRIDSNENIEKQLTVHGQVQRTLPQIAGLP